jgi:hypothetical protein
LSPDLRVIVAVAPFAAAMTARLIIGRTPMVRWLVTLSTIWFAINILMAPYSTGMRQELLSLPAVFR